jgi:phage repressor protein C with HTH and peptisase S24 domain
MKDIDEIRRDNLRIIEREIGSPSKAAKVIDMSPAQFANLRDGAKDSKTGKPRGMRKDTARRIEKKCGKPSMWLDMAHEDQENNVYFLTSGANIQEEVGDKIRIPQFDIRFSMGGGQEVDDYPEVIRTWEVAPEWVIAFAPEFRGNPRKDLCIATGVGNCLLPWYHNGDHLLLDRSVEGRPLRAAGIFAFRFDGMLYVKELRPIGKRGADAFERDGNRAFSIDFSQHDFKLIARVLRAWRMELM